VAAAKDDLFLFTQIPILALLSNCPRAEQLLLSCSPPALVKFPIRFIFTERLVHVTLHRIQLRSFFHVMVALAGFTLPLSADKYCCGCQDGGHRTCESPSWCGGECGVVWCGTVGDCSQCSTHYYDGRHFPTASTSSATTLLSLAFTGAEWQKLLGKTATPTAKKIAAESKSAGSKSVTMSKKEWESLLKDIENTKRN